MRVYYYFTKNNQIYIHIQSDYALAVKLFENNYTKHFEILLTQKKYLALYEIFKYNLNIKRNFYNLCWTNVIKIRT